MQTKFIAEIASNHNGDINRAIRFIEMAKIAGCWGVKFQLFNLRKLFAPEALAIKPELLKREQWELPRIFIPTLSNAAMEYGLAFGCTPFDVESSDYLYNYVDFYKIASYSLLDKKLLWNVAEKNKPMMISTGAATMPEIIDAISFIRGCNSKINLTVLHCLSAYPAPIEQCNLSTINRLRGQGTKVGWSDHSKSEAVILSAALRYNADVIEFHLNDDFGHDGGLHCWNLNEIRKTIAMCNDGFLADGGLAKTYDVELSEKYERDWRADPSDGLRPLLSKRKEIMENVK